MGNDNEMAASADAAPRPLFAVRLTPYRSLPPVGFLILMGVIGTMSFVAGLAFWVHGAWPVFGFFGLDVAAVYVAFRVNYRAALAYEDIEMTPERLCVRKVSSAGVSREFSFQPYWTRLEVERVPEFGITRIALTSKGRRLLVGTFLNPDDRESFVKVFGAALAEARRGA